MKVVELIQAGKYDELKNVLEEKLATKIKDKIQEKKMKFVDGVKKAKKIYDISKSDTTTSSSEE